MGYNVKGKSISFNTTKQKTVKQTLKSATVKQAQRESLVKRVNQRYVDLVQHLGRDNSYVKRYEQVMNRISTVSTSKSGNLKVSKAGKLNDEDIHNLNILNNMSTYGTIKMKAQQQLGKEKLTVEDVKKYVAWEDDIHKLVKEHAKEIYNSSVDLMNALHRKGQLTIEEGNKLIELSKEGFPEQHMDMDTWLASVDWGY